MLKNTDPALAYQNSPLRGWQSEYPTQSGWDTNTFVAAKAFPTKGENERTISKERNGKESDRCVLSGFPPIPIHHMWRNVGKKNPKVKMDFFLVLFHFCGGNRVSLLVS